MSDMVDLFDGKELNAWVDEELVFLTIYGNGITLTVPKEDFLKLAEDVGNVAKAFIEKGGK